MGAATPGPVASSLTGAAIHAIGRGGEPQAALGGVCTALARQACMRRSTCLAFAIVICLGACDLGGEYLPGGELPDPAAPDADPAAPDADPSAPDAAPGAPDAEAAANCAEPVLGVPSGEHNAGQPCQPCHGPGGNAPLWSLGGTLYTSAAGTSPLSGATIRVSDADGQTLDLVTAANGNFWTSAPVAFPITVLATRCPDSVPMIAPVASPGDCNSAGCHSAGAPSGRIHLP